MDYELKMTLELDGQQVEAFICYEPDGYKPLVYGVFDSKGQDITQLISESEYDRAYVAACDDVVDRMMDNAESRIDR